VNISPRKLIGTWWELCVQGQIEPEPIEFCLIDKKTGETMATTTQWEMEGFSRRWGTPTAGVLNIRVRQGFQQMGLGRFLFSHLLRYLQEQFYGSVEVQNPEENRAGDSFLKSLGFELIDTGKFFHKSINPKNPIVK
jgi:ribosomal protein S18 acetylase RimI-like enzyme